jgi:hypothetical protein
VAPPERTTRSGTASVLPPAPTILSSRVRISNREPARRDLGEEKSDEDGDGYELEKRGKGRDDSDGDEGEDEDIDMDEGKDAPILRFGPPKGRRDAASVDGKILIFVTVNLFLFF